jgi:hypothetical protein
MYGSVASTADAELMTSSLGRGMSLLWTSNRAGHKDVESCLDVLEHHSSTKTVAALLRQLEDFATTSFHRHKELKMHAVNFAGTLMRVLPDQAGLLASVVRIVSTHRLHPAALRFTSRHLPDATRQSFYSVLRQLDTAVAQKVEDLPATAVGEHAPIYDEAGVLSEAYDPDARTWLKNFAITVKLTEPIERARLRFASFASEEWERDEDELSVNLCRMLFDELQKWPKDEDLQKWVKESYGYGSIKLDQPYVRDVEVKWGADIGIVLNINVNKTHKHQWGYLLQAKKAKGPATNPTRWDIDRDQLDDLLLRSSAGFYLLYTPITESAAPFVIPARTVSSILGAVDDHRKAEAKSIPYRAGRDLGKSWTSFFLEDLIGSWSGEPDEDLVKRIKGGQESRAVLEVTVALGRQAG